MASVLIAPSYRGYRYPAELISYAVSLYYRFSLSLRDVEELLAERGVTVTHGDDPRVVRQVRSELCCRITPSTTLCSDNGN